MHWFYLASAILFEVAGTTSMKLSYGFTRLLPSILLFVFYAISFVSLTFAVKKIDMSVSYAIWSGVGTALIQLCRLLGAVPHAVSSPGKEAVLRALGAESVIDRTGVTDWHAAVGRLTDEAIRDNTRSWSGDHCMDPAQVPGVVYANRALDRDDCALVDLAPTILDLCGVPVPRHMHGRSLLNETT